MNGKRNHDTWNVALWVSNDPGIYFAAVEYVGAEDGPTWDGFVEWAGLAGEVTGDGVAFDSPEVDAEELTALLLDMGEEG